MKEILIGGKVIEMDLSYNEIADEGIKILFEAISIE